MIFLITCNRCLQSYAVSWMVNEFRNRWNSYNVNATLYAKTPVWALKSTRLLSVFKWCLSQLLTRQTLKILLNEKITGLTPLKTKQHWNLVFKIVFSTNCILLHVLYFVLCLWTAIVGDYFPVFIVSNAAAAVLLLLLFLVLLCY